MNQESAASQVNQVVNNLAEKLGVAAESLQPLAETIVHEYVMRCWMEFLAYVIGIVVLNVSAWAADRFIMIRFKDESEPVLHPFCAATVRIGSLMASIPLFAHGALAIIRAVSPHYSILKDLL